MKACPFYLVLLFGALQLNAQIEYPESAEIPVVNTYHGVEVIDNYQWLERENSSEVDDWKKEQNGISEKYLRKLVRATKTEEKMNKFMFRKTAEYEGNKVNTLAKNSYYFNLMYTGYNNTPDLFYKKGYRGKYKILVNSEKISTKDEIVITHYSTSKNNQYLAYAYSRNGSDWKEIRVVEPKSRKHHDDLIEHTKHSGIYWLNEGFFYKKYPFDSISGRTVLPEIRYHQLGQAQVQDQLIFKAQDENDFLSLYRSPNEDIYIIQKEDFDKKTYSYYFLDPAKNKLSFRPLILNIPYDLRMVYYDEGELLALGKVENNTHLISIPVAQPQQWKVISPQYQDAVYKDHVIVGDKIIMTFQGLKNDIFSMIDFDGKVLKELPMPAGLSVVSLQYRKEFGEILFKMQSYTIPPVLCRLDVETFDYEIIEETKVNFDFTDYKFTEVFFTSHDGTEVPIFIVYKNELKRDGNTPFLLKTYGGYGQLGSPAYHAGIVYFIENGGAFAYVNVRGGGKLGNDWWENGRGLKKKNSIFDFISAAEYLIEEGFTKPKQIAATGTSHGGLVTAAAVVQRPELFGSAVVNVGVTDMLRFENFTAGATSTNLSEFGSVENKADFENLYSYSPFHNIKKGTGYPSMLIVTGTDDNRVPPLHSYKFAARLQNNPAQVNPVLLWTQDQSGHAGAMNMNGILEENSFIYGFLFNELQKDHQQNE